MKKTTEGEERCGKEQENSLFNLLLFGIASRSTVKNFVVDWKIKKIFFVSLI